MLIPTIDSIEALAELLGIPKFVLTRYIFQADRYYKCFRIPKRSGRGYRIISAPSKQMKGLQRWITMFVLRKIEVSRFSTAFREGCSVVNNANPHTHKQFVFCADVANFFPSITSKRITGLFKSLDYPPEVAFALSKLTSYKNSLPQGAPSSPDIANILCRKLDVRLAGLCKKRQWEYTRYCDDITISGIGGMSSFMQKIIEKIFQEEGFVLNPYKTRIKRRNSRQVVTGLVVNDKVRIPRDMRRRWRAVFHQANLDPPDYAHRLSNLRGYVSFLSMVNPSDTSLAKYRSIICALEGQVTE